MERLTPQRQPLAAFMVLLILRDSMHIPCMVAQLTLDTLGDAATRALGPRLVALLLYGSAARGTHVPKRSDVNTLLICDAVDARSRSSMRTCETRTGCSRGATPGPASESTTTICAASSSAS